MKGLLGLLLIAGFGRLGEAGPHHQSLLCLSCHDIRDPHDCTNVELCPREHKCSSEVRLTNGIISYTLRCEPHHECATFTEPVGKRELKCRKCCATIGCNKNLCDQYRPTTTTSTTTTTTTTTTQAPTTTTLPLCRDHEEDGFSCASYEAFNFCTETAGFAYNIAHTKCPKHCGFCGPNAISTTAKPTTAKPTTPMPTTTMPTTPEPTTPMPTTPMPTTPMPTTTMPTTTPMPTTTAMPTTTRPTTTTTPMVTATSKAMSNLQATSPKAPCEDREDDTFKCSDNSNLCTATDFYTKLLALDRCAKFCSLCGQSI